MEAFNSPRPTPKFYAEQQTFSTKKSRGTPRDSLPPRPPAKSAPPISRIFPHRLIQRAQIVSFRDDDSNGSLLQYSENGNKLYFDQQFQIIRKLGAGSFGDVYKVMSRDDGQLYAIKRSKDRFRGENDRKRKLEEVAKHETLPPHPNCVRFYKAWEERQHLYIQTELCQTSLNSYTEQNHDISEVVVWNFLVDLLMAVKHLHDHNVVHMDIKPENIFISNDDVCKLGDFGLMLDMSSTYDLSEAQEGDPKYMAPELMNGKFSKAADIFSLGITILELASDLDLPRGGRGWHLLRSGQLPEEFLRDKSFDMKYVIQQMLDPDPTSRPTVDQALAFPYVRKVWKRRRREYMVKNAVNTVKFAIGRFFEFLLLITTVFTVPYNWIRGRPALQSTPSLSSRSSRSNGSSNISGHGTGLDCSISDDECFDNEISISNNSFGAPLDSSSSSESFMYAEPLKPPARRAYTTPVYRHRPEGFVSSPMSSSPVIPGKIRRPSSPDTSFDNSFEEERSLTPTFNTSSHNIIEGEENTKHTIEPKNLLDMFAAASDEDEED